MVIWLGGRRRGSPALLNRTGQRHGRSVVVSVTHLRLIQSICSYRGLVLLAGDPPPFDEAPHLWLRTTSQDGFGYSASP